MREPSTGKPPWVTSPEGRLDSWKAIAAYLNRDVTTAQRWEKREGMPVHRHLHDKGGSVYALTAELESWLQNRKPGSEDGQKEPGGETPFEAEGDSVRRETTRVGRWLGLAGAVMLVLAVVGTYHFWPRPPKSTAKDSIVIADFTNTTGDPVFDGALRLALAAQLDQSPFLSIASDQQIAEALRLMNQPASVRLTQDLARQVCERTGGTAVLDGSIAQIGGQYSIVLDALNCSSGASLARTQAVASDKNHVLPALGNVASTMRKKLGESLATIQKFDVPVDQVTTPSLEALKAYSLGTKALMAEDFPAAISEYQRAISFDPNFAMAYARLGALGGGTTGGSQAVEYLTKAYALRDRVSEREKFYISSHYIQLVSGDLQKATQVYELWAQTYPHDFAPYALLSYVYSALGQYDKGLTSARRGVELAPTAINYESLAFCYLYVDRVDAAASVMEQAKADGMTLYGGAYQLGFLRGDTAAMERELAWAAGKPGVEASFLLYAASDAAAYGGQLAKAEDLTARAVDSAQRSDEKEVAAGYAAEAALRLALFGHYPRARSQAAAALRISSGRDSRAVAILAMTLAGNAAHAQKLADDLNKRYPQDTVVQFNYLPEIRAAIALDQKDPAKAIATLQAAAPYELGTPALAISLSLYPVYVRGLAFLTAHQGAMAVAEFQKILDHPGVVLCEPIGALAHLGLARARAFAGDSAGARKAYQDFFALWQHADPNIPILQQAKAEYAKLQ